MRHLKSGRKFGRNSSHRKAMFRNLATALFKHEKIQTTDSKAKELRSFAEKLITKARGGTLHQRRLVAEEIHDKEIVKKLVEEIAPRFAGRPGGYTRVTKIGFRRGDGADLAIIELVGEEFKPKKSRKRRRKRGAGGDEAAAETTAAPAAESAPEAATEAEAPAADEPAAEAESDGGEQDKEQ